MRKELKPILPTQGEFAVNMETVKALLLAEYSPEQWALAFFLYGFAGWCWEVALYLVKERRFVNRGFLTGPILPIYGFGAMTILVVCVPVKWSAPLVALTGALAATLLEFVTGAAMEALFHVRYWDYSHARFNLHGYVCLKATLTWAAFSLLVVLGVHPFFRQYLTRIPEGLSAALAAACTTLAVADTVSAVRRALDLRALLESMERCAKELESLRGGLDSVGDRVSERVRAFAGQVGARHEELAARLERMNAARAGVATQLRERGVTLEEAARQRFAAFERALADIADLVPDTAPLRGEIDALRARYDRLAAQTREARERSASRVRALLRRNPGAVSRRHDISFAALREELERREQNEKHNKEAKK